MKKASEIKLGFSDDEIFILHKMMMSVDMLIADPVVEIKDSVLSNATVGITVACEIRLMPLKRWRDMGFVDFPLKFGFSWSDQNKLSIDEAWLVWRRRAIVELVGIAASTENYLKKIQTNNHGTKS